MWKSGSPVFILSLHIDFASSYEVSFVGIIIFSQEQIGISELSSNTDRLTMKAFHMSLQPFLGIISWLWSLRVLVLFVAIISQLLFLDSLPLDSFLIVLNIFRSSTHNEGDLLAESIIATNVLVKNLSVFLSDVNKAEKFRWTSIAPKVKNILYKPSIA